jgi:cytoskeletal protein CcmA (bactofilin family)
MSEYDPKKASDAGQASCAYFGEGLIFKGSITAPEKVVVHGTVEGEVVARDLLVGPTGTIKGKVSVDQADVEGKIFDHVEAKVLLSLRKTGRVEGSAKYGQIEIEKGGILSGEVSTSGDNKQTMAQQPPKAQANLPLPPHVVSNNPSATTSDSKTNVEANKFSAVGGNKPLFSPDNKR